MNACILICIDILVLYDLHRLLHTAYVHMAVITVLRLSWIQIAVYLESLQIDLVISSAFVQVNFRFQ